MDNKITAALTILVILISGKAFSLTIGKPDPYIIEAGDYLFVMIPGNVKPDKELNISGNTEKDLNSYCSPNSSNSRDEASYSNPYCTWLKYQNRFKLSGMYRKAGSNKPLWTTDWYSEGGVMVSSDGEYVIVLGRWLHSTLDSDLALFKRDKLLAKYQVDDLVKDRSKEKGKKKIHRWHRITFFDDSNKTFFLRTIDGNEYVFDMHSGKIIQHNYTPSPIYNAQFILKNDKREHVNDVQYCSWFTRTINGKPEPTHYLFVTLSITPTQNGKGVHTEYGKFPFRFIEKIEQEKQLGKEQVIWNMFIRDSKVRNAVIAPDKGNFCGKDRYGNDVEVDFGDFKTMEISQVEEKR